MIPGDANAPAAYWYAWRAIYMIAEAVKAYGRGGSVRNFDRCWEISAKAKQLVEDAKRIG